NVAVAAIEENVDGGEGLTVGGRGLDAVEGGLDLNARAAGVAGAHRIDHDGVIADGAADEPQRRADHGSSRSQDGEGAVGQLDVVVGGGAGAIGDHGGDGVDTGGGRAGVAAAAVGEVEGLAVDAGVESGGQVGGQVGGIADGLGVIADGVADGGRANG